MTMVVKRDFHYVVLHLGCAALQLVQAGQGTVALLLKVVLAELDMVVQVVERVALEDNKGA
tara:strand:- start:2801 stop:2983 length:183 start_codon:yes stop_codon:yes gene_type:complete